MTIDPLPKLAHAELETLLAALDPRLDGFGEGESCLDDASAYLERLGSAGETTPDGLSEGLHLWLNAWKAADGNRQTLSLAVRALLELSRPVQAPPIELLWPDSDPSPRLHGLVDAATRRLLIVCRWIDDGGERAAEPTGLIRRARERMDQVPDLQVRLVFVIRGQAGPAPACEESEDPLGRFRRSTWPQLWGPASGTGDPEVYGILDPTNGVGASVSTVGMVLADGNLLIPSGCGGSGASAETLRPGTLLRERALADSAWERVEDSVTGNHPHRLF